MKYYGRRLAEDLNENLDCDLHIHRGSAYALPQEGSRLGMLFPGNNAVSDMILLVCREVRRKVEEGSWKVETDETIHVDRLEFERLLKDVKRAYGSGFTKQYREIQEGEYVETMMEELRIWSFIRVIEKEHMVFIYPAAGKIQEDTRRIIQEEIKMSSRWQANKIGLINFWYYDEQEFSFCKRKNASSGI